MIDHCDLLLDGRWEPAAGDRRFDLFSPVTDEVICRVADAEEADAARAVEAAATALAPWTRTPERERAAILHRAADLLDERQPRSPTTWSSSPAKS